jgi:hypothetical protein
MGSFALPVAAYGLFLQRPLQLIGSFLAFRCSLWVQKKSSAKSAELVFFGHS